jgi:hypothetical protein
MTNPVNPPPQLRIPDALAKDREVFGFFRQINQILFQLWNRTGGEDDAIADAQEPVIATAFAQLKVLNERVGSGELLTADTTSWTVDSTRFWADETEA